jgi:hypothetical protein
MVSIARISLFRRRVVERAEHFVREGQMATALFMYLIPTERDQSRQA